MDALNPHTCSHCQEIIIDLKTPFRKQEFRYTFERVAAYARECAFFQWAMDFARRETGGTDLLIMSVEDVETYPKKSKLTASWGRNESFLYIFTVKGK
jgi:hypothetical protein